MCLCDTWYLLFCVDDCLQPFHGKEPHRLQQAGSRAPHGEITVSGMTNSLNYFVIFVVDTQFTNMAAGRIIQAGGPRGGDPHVIEFSPSCSFNFNFKAGALGVYREIFLFLNTLSIMFHCSKFYLKNILCTYRYSQGSWLNFFISFQQKVSCVSQKSDCDLLHQAN